ncbi:FGFR1 oncogene partner 2 homolog [Copidosoma floridanum]|uniref:FGFR1 oncogene partner 2 homolog n=1 Tax=Copidosoma floridanum TaxID=29053 RepID=UPI0006C93D86|nr:FGFR1 oncogene partner 2 homolog [Copidosoma floridanum]XP_014214658.1 FGFR1 oncogene partner 2 homolog [Copidosoma floridanum]XP_014214668.1 FGFR1 oncogene partner 2 homolog [Copidosoma floridanum]XP_014214678.1 FGFR1 oncogene partner 2 homolog [Copidosoma floridanum]XP_014214687.1 FGFR1 oncogene partner 2 homolog [Copidosoma floridanum]
MALAFQQIILDAGKLVNDMTTQEKTADLLICEIQNVVGHIEGMKQYKEDLETISTEADQKQRQEIISGFKKGNNEYFRELQAENKDLRLALEDYQKALEQIMSKYRQQTAYFLKQTKNNETAIPSTECCSQYNECRCVNVISEQAEKIDEMTTVMRTASEIHEQNDLKYIETLGQLKEENNGLREILNVVNKYNAKSDVAVEDKNIQTDNL